MTTSGKDSQPAHPLGQSGLAEADKGLPGHFGPGKAIGYVQNIDHQSQFRCDEARSQKDFAGQDGRPHTIMP